MENTYIPVLTSSVRTATTNGSTFQNYDALGLHVVIDVTAVPGGDTVTPQIQGYDTLSGKYYPILIGTAIIATGTTVLKIYPGIAAVINGSANDVLPSAWRVVMTHSAGTNFTYTVSASLLG